MAELVYCKVNCPVETPFKCGNKSIEDKIVGTLPYELLLLRRCNTYEVKYKGATVGYYMICLKQFDLDQFPEPIEDHVVNSFEDLYALHIEYIAVKTNYQKIGIGSSVLKKIIRDTKKVSEILPLRLITIDALKECVGWYQKFQFKSCGEESDNSAVELMYLDLVPNADIKKLEMLYQIN